MQIPPKRLTAGRDLGAGLARVGRQIGTVIDSFATMPQKPPLVYWGVLWHGAKLTESAGLTDGFSSTATTAAAEAQPLTS